MSRDDADGARLFVEASSRTEHLSQVDVLESGQRVGYLKWAPLLLAAENCLTKQKK